MCQTPALNFFKNFTLILTESDNLIKIPRFCQFIAPLLCLAVIHVTLHTAQHFDLAHEYDSPVGKTVELFESQNGHTTPVDHAEIADAEVVSGSHSHPESTLGTAHHEDSAGYSCDVCQVIDPGFFSAQTPPALTHVKRLAFGFAVNAYRSTAFLHYSARAPPTPLELNKT